MRDVQIERGGMVSGIKHVDQTSSNIVGLKMFDTL